MRVRIVNVSHATRELPQALLPALRAAYPHLDFEIHSHLDYDTPELQIVVCPAGLGLHGPLRQPRLYVALQLEEYPVLDNPYYRNFLDGAAFHWDYSTLNLAKTRERYPLLRPIQCRIGYSPSVAGHLRPYSDDNRPIDVLFLGWDAHPRRKRIIGELKAFCRVFVTHEATLQDMQRLIQRAKICVNIHAKEQFVLQTVRLNILLSNQACVVSEPAEDADAQLRYSGAVVFSSDLPSAVRLLLADPARRASLAAESLAWYRLQPWSLPGLETIPAYAETA